MKSLIKGLVPKPIWQFLSSTYHEWFPSYSRDSYSQEGEDLVLERFLEGRRSGFYVDVGAHHPMRFSNTYRLYRRGWRGLNIDANPGSMDIFRRVRPRDINVEAAISAGNGQLTYYVFNDPALNTFDAERALALNSDIYHIVKEVNVSTRPLRELLDQYVPKGVPIDLLTIDVEGFDLQVLESNDWDRYIPEFVLIECLGVSDLAQAYDDPAAKFLLSKGYRAVSRMLNTLLFRRTGSHADSIRS
jgi:FkbM family methyltransferase